MTSSPRQQTGPSSSSTVCNSDTPAISATSCRSRARVCGAAHSSADWAAPRQRASGPCPAAAR
eukprot:11221487-Lingulodinium_polyedra.AAC.1